MNPNEYEELDENMGTAEDIHDTALYLMLACGINMGGDHSPLELAGAANIAIASIVNEMMKNEQETNIIEGEGVQGTTGQSEQVSGAGVARGNKKGSKRSSKTK